MGDLDLMSDEWSPAQRLQWRERITPIGGVVSLVLCVIAQIVYCIIYYHVPLKLFFYDTYTSFPDYVYFLDLFCRG